LLVKFDTEKISEHNLTFLVIRRWNNILFSCVPKKIYNSALRYLIHLYNLPTDVRDIIWVTSHHLSRSTIWHSATKASYHSIVFLACSKQDPQSALFLVFYISFYGEGAYGCMLGPRRQQRRLLCDVNAAGYDFIYIYHCARRAARSILARCTD
jgi:hypothetical protein